jgi:hypothetical protein
VILTKEQSINAPIEKVWDVLGNQFGQIDKWASMMKESSVSRDPRLPDAMRSIRSLETTQGHVEQELRTFVPGSHSLSYAAIAGAPFFIKSVVTSWSLTQLGDSNTKLNLQMDIQTQGLVGLVLGPVAKSKLGKLTDGLLEEFKYYVENDRPHPRKAAGAR